MAAINEKQAIAILNHMLGLDQKAISALFTGFEAPINGHLAEWEPLQIHYNKQFGTNAVRLLGVINALFGTVQSGPYKGKGVIWTIQDDEGLITQFVHYSEVDNFDVEKAPL